MTILHRTRKLFREPSYALGRFLTVRRLYALGKRVCNPPPPAAAVEGYYAGVDVPKAIHDMRRDAFTLLPPLPPEPVAEILAFANAGLCTGRGIADPFHYNDLNRGRLPDGRPVPMAHVQDCLACPAVARIRDDDTLHRIIANYLGYTTRHREVRLYWSLVVDLTEQERRDLGQTIDYHFDVYDYNFAYLHLYISDTDALSGAHVLVRGSHRKKPFRWLFGSARQSDAAVQAVYPAEDILVLEGHGGYGMLEDTSCYHKALAPVKADRLLFQIRYH
jgi:hypothetical protein